MINALLIPFMMSWSVEGLLNSFEIHWRDRAPLTFGMSWSDEVPLKISVMSWSDGALLTTSEMCCSDETLLNNFGMTWSE